ncbi:MAG: FAD:protein FMN transferase [Actinomycetota bacterium]|nr:FAD:protein FMN transferase [Actinomycetota bacterium]
MERKAALSVLGTVSLVAALCASSLALAGCDRNDPVVDAREKLGTVVTVTAYGEDRVAVGDAVDAAFDAMDRVAGQLDSYDASSAISAANAYLAKNAIRAPLPPYSLEILNSVERLGVSEQFSVTIGAAVGLYDFGGSGHVPTAAELDAVLEPRLERRGRNIYLKPFGLGKAGTVPPPSLDFGGASKGLALDEALRTLASSGAVDAAILTSGSTTVTMGSKPDGSQWQVGIEDPRDTSSVVAVARGTGPFTVSTSGDYQQYFERDGVRYHHILDPATGLPASGLRSLTVIGASSGVESDILSTALFVAGPDGAPAYALESGLALFLVDSEGRAQTVPAPEGASFSITEGSGSEKP